MNVLPVNLACKHDLVLNNQGFIYYNLATKQVIDTLLLFGQNRQ